MAPKPVSVVVVGAGRRARIYASYARYHPDKMQVVGVADPDEMRRTQIAEMYHIPAERCFRSAEELAARPRFADAAINGTMDREHVPTSLPLLEAGYHLLLEKPFATNEEEMWQLAALAAQKQRKVMICHVLRYAPFYARIKEMAANGVIGVIINIQTAEHVGYQHMAAAYVRGKWNRESACGSSMLMAKCCHDLDIIAWLKSGIPPVAVGSFGSRMVYRADNAPAEAGTQCLLDCSIEAECPYSVRKHHLANPKRWTFVWDQLAAVPNPTHEQRAEMLKTSPHGRCVWKCDNDVVDHQSVIIQFQDGSTATHNMIGGAARAARTIHLIGTRGEISGVLEDNRLVLRLIDGRSDCEYKEEVINTAFREANGMGRGHAGGDSRLVSDFVRVMQGEPPSISYTGIEDSLAGHLIGFRADRARLSQQVVKLA